MGRRIDDTEPTGTPAVLDESEPAPPPAPFYAPATDDPELQLLQRLRPPPAPRPVDLPETDGELAARYYASARPLAVGGRTPAPEANVQLACTADIPRADVVTAPIAHVAPIPRDTRRDAQTVEIPIVRRRSAPHLLVACVLGTSVVIGLVAIGISVLSSSTDSERRELANATPSAKVQATVAPLVPSAQASAPSSSATSSSTAPENPQPLATASARIPPKTPMARPARKSVAPPSTPAPQLEEEHL